MSNYQNAIWIFGDQHRAQALSCNGDPNLNTPNIDRLSIEGQNYERAVSGFPLCCPFRGSLLSSQYPHKCVPGHEYQMPEGTLTVANAFNDQGFDTAYFGKWHVDGFHESEGRAAMHYVPPERRGGFNIWLGYDNNNAQWDSWVHGHRRDQEVKHYRLPGYETDCLTDLLIEYINEQGEKRQNGDETPFFAVLSVQPPHNPYLAPAEFMERHNPETLLLRPNVPQIDRIQKEARLGLAGAYAQIENLDWNLGRVREALSANGLDFNTNIIFFSDHGDLHGSHGQYNKTSPLEESIRIPFIIGGTPCAYDHGRGRQDYLINHVDIAPTTLGLCGIDKPDWMVGFDYSGTYRLDRPRPEAPESAFIQSVIPTGHGNSVDRPWRCVVTRDGWKYVVLEHQPWMLFNLNEDPYEQANLAHNSVFKNQRKRLQDLMVKWIEDTDDSFIMPEI